MAINIDSYINVQYSGVTVERIGLSAGLDTISNDDILEYMFCGSYNKIIHGVIPRKTDVPMTQYRQEIPFNFEMDDPRVQIDKGGYDLNPNGMYMGVIWLYTDIFANHPENNGNLSHFKIVMEWDAPNYFATCPDPNGKRDNITSWGASDTSKCFATNGTFTALTYVFQNHNINVPDIYPYMIFKTTEGGDDLLFISCLRQNANTFRVRPYTRGTQIRFIGTTTLKSFRNNEQTYSPVGAKMLTYEKTLPYKWNMGSSPGQASTNPDAYGTTEMTNLFFYTEGGSNAASTIGCMDWTWFLDTKDESLLFWASSGLKFKAGTVTYKPIITNGLVVGFSNDMTTPSDLDDWSGSTKHGIPVTPISPSGDKIDDMSMNPLWAMSSDAGFANYFLLSNTDLNSLKNWLTNTTFPDGYDPYPYIISLIQFPLKLSPGYCMPRTPAGHIVIGGEDTGITASLFANEKASKGIGVIDVPRENGNFLDYSPYTQYEVYIPCCGWVSVPDIIAGRRINVEVNYDLTTASIIGNVYVHIDGNKMIVASKSGMMGRETIVTGEAQGVRSAQITSALLSAGTGALNVATGAMSSNAVAALNGTYGIVSGLAQANIAANSSYARTVGSTGGRAILCQYDACYLHVSTTEADIPPSFGHTCGYLCNISGKVSSFSGYTVFDNVDVSGFGSATDREKQIIKRILESGVIVNHPSP